MGIEFTVVIPTYNRANFIEKAIRSVTHQTYKNWRILIIDDASTDRTERVVQKYLFDPNIHYHRMPKNSGISRVMNEAMNLVTTPYLIQLDSDDWLAKTALERFDKAIRKDKEKSALYYGNVAMFRYRRGKYTFKKKIKFQSFTTKYSFLKYHGYIIAPRCYKVSALREVRGWDISDKYHGRYMEDRRIILRLIERFRIKWINKTMYKRTKHKNQLTNPKHIRKRNRLRKQTVTYYLKRWGNKFKAVFGYQNKAIVVKYFKRRKKPRKLYRRKGR